MKFFFKQDSNRAYSFLAKVATYGYHIYRNTTWEETKCGDKVLIDLETDEKSMEIDPYCGSINAMGGRPQWLKPGNIPRESLFLPERGKRPNWRNYLVNYRPSPIHAWGLENPLILNFKSLRFSTHLKMKKFVTSLFSFDFVAKEAEPSSSGKEEEINLLIQESSVSGSEVDK